jgi:hypothetical protein
MILLEDFTVLPIHVYFIRIAFDRQATEALPVSPQMNRLVFRKPFFRKSRKKEIFLRGNAWAVHFGLSLSLICFVNCGYKKPPAVVFIFPNSRRLNLKNKRLFSPLMR